MFDAPAVEQPVNKMLTTSPDTLISIKFRYMKKKYAPIDLPPELQAFRARFLAATEVEVTMCGVTFYKMHGRHFARTKSSLTGKQVKKDKRFQRTMQQAAVLALAAKYVTPIYNELTADWRCHDLYRKLVSIGIKAIHQGATKEIVQQEVYEELQRLGYRTAWPVWELPPNLKEWMEEVSGALSAEPGIQHAESACETMYVIKGKFVRIWVVNEKGQLTFYTIRTGIVQCCRMPVYLQLHCRCPSSLLNPHCRRSDPVHARLGRFIGTGRYGLLGGCGQWGSRQSVQPGIVGNGYQGCAITPGAFNRHYAIQEGRFPFQR